MGRDQSTSGLSARPLPKCLTRLLLDPKSTTREAPADDLKPGLVERAQWWFDVALFGAVSLIYGAALKIAGLWS